MGFQPGNPNLVCCRTAQDNRARYGAYRESVVVVALDHAEFCSGPDTSHFQKLQQFAVAFVDATDQVVLTFLGGGQQQQPAPFTARGTFHFAQVAMWAGAATPKF